MFVTDRLWHLVSVEKMCGQPSRLAARTWAQTFVRCQDEPGCRGSDQQRAEKRWAVTMASASTGFGKEFRSGSETHVLTLNTATVDRPSLIILAGRLHEATR